VAAIRCLIVGEDSRSDCSLLTHTLERLQIGPVAHAHDADAALTHLASHACDVVFLCARLAHTFLSRLAYVLSDARIILVGGALSPDDAFAYGQLGIDAWLPNPGDASAVLARLQAVLHGPSALDRMAAAHLGRYGLKDAQHVVRRSMIAEALGRTKGNRHAAARLLRVDRRAVQLALKELEDAESSAPSACYRVGRGLIHDAASSRLEVDELRELVAQRVVRRTDNVVVWREFEVPTVDSVEAVFSRLAALRTTEPIHLVIDLEEARYPDEEVRECLREHFRADYPFGSITVHTGKNHLMALAARVVLSDARPFSFSPSSLPLDSAVRPASLAPARRAV
jgi:ActR/RegA family two-component response regulator